MLGAIAGDIIGSVHEFATTKTTEFPLFVEDSEFTDDTILTVALADAILHDLDYAETMKKYVRRYPHASYGGRFRIWAASPDNAPYNSFGNGSAMRISPVGWAFDSLPEVLSKAKFYTEVTHNHPEGIKGAQATAAAIYLARIGSSKNEIKEYVVSTFGYHLDRNCDAIRPTYMFDESCQRTVPEAIIAFLDSNDYESAVRLAISLGGDADTLACITGGIAEAFYGGVPKAIADESMALLDEPLSSIVEEFLAKYCRQSRD